MKEKALYCDEHGFLGTTAWLGVIQALIAKHNGETGENGRLGAGYSWNWADPSTPQEVYENDLKNAAAIAAWYMSNDSV